MTLVLSVATPAYSLQVSDRLVSKAGEPYDPLANKNVVLRATDGLLVFGYTGLAFLDGLPTDTWIADQISGGACASIGGVLAYGNFAVRDVGSSLMTLSQPLQTNSAFRECGGEICAVGWQWNGKRERALVRNVLWRLQPEDGRLCWSQLVPRHVPERKGVFRMTAIGNWAMSAEAWQALLERVGSAGPDWGSVETLLVEAIRGAAEHSSGTIGTHCMSILARPWMFPNALVKFMPESPYQSDAMGQSVEVSYSPWMVAPDAIHAPAVSVGGLSCEQGLLSYSMETPAPAADQLLKGAFQSQKETTRLANRYSLNANAQSTSRTTRPVRPTNSIASATWFDSSYASRFRRRTKPWAGSNMPRAIGDPSSASRRKRGGIDRNRR